MCFFVQSERLFGIQEADIFGFPVEEEEIALRTLGFEKESHEGHGYLPTFVELERDNLKVTILS